MRDYHNMALFWGVSLLSEGKALCIRQSEHSVDLGQIQQLFVDREEGYCS